MSAPLVGAAAGAALLDLDTSKRCARPLRAWSRAHTESLRQHFVALRRDWHAEWFDGLDAAAPAEADVVVWSAGVPASETTAFWSFAMPATRGADAPHFPRPGAEAPHSLLPAANAPRAAMRAIAGRMFGLDASAASAASAGGTAGTAGAASQAEPCLALEVAHAAWQDWLLRLRTMLRGFALDALDALDAREPGEATNPDSAIPAIPAAGAWSGALRVHWPWCGGHWRIDLPHEAVAALVGSPDASLAAPHGDSPRPPKARLDHALSARRVALRVMLEGSALNLGQLQALRVGDVLPLAHPLDAPARLVGDDGTLVCRAWLGQHGRRIAVELAALNLPTD